MKTNAEIREVIKKSGVKHWELAQILGVSENTLVRWLRIPLTNERQESILNALNTVAKEAQ